MVHRVLRSGVREEVPLPGFGDLVRRGNEVVFVQSGLDDHSTLDRPFPEFEVNCDGRVVRGARTNHEGLMRKVTGFERASKYVSYAELPQNIPLPILFPVLVFRCYSRVTRP